MAMDAAVGAEEAAASRRGVALLLGIPGAGKSTLADRLAAALEAGAEHKAAESSAAERHERTQDAAQESDAASGGGGVAVTVLHFDDFQPAAEGEGAETRGDAHGAGGDGSGDDEAERAAAALRWHAGRHEGLLRLFRWLDGGDDPCRAGGCGTRRELCIVDDNMYYRSMRHEVFQRCRKAGVAFMQVYVEVDVEEAKVRNSARALAQQVPHDVIDRMDARLEVPSERGWEAGHSVTLDTSKGLDASVREMVVHAGTLWKLIPAPIAPSRESELAAAREATRESCFHAVDLLLRQLVGTTVRSSEPSSRRLVARAAGAAKAATVKLLKDLPAESLSSLQDAANTFFAGDDDVASAHAGAELFARKTFAAQLKEHAFT